VPLVDNMRERQGRKEERENHGKRLRDDDAAMAVVAVSNIAAHPGQKKHGNLTGEPENAEEGGGSSEVIDEPLLGRVLHPRADQRNQLPDDEELKVPVLQSPEPCGQVQNRVHPFVG
jgi:hypothetical protein